MWVVIESIVCEINSWVIVKNEFASYSLNDLVRDWVTCIRDFNVACVAPPLRRNSLDVGTFKVNFDVASRGNPGLLGFGCVFRDANGHVMGVKGWSVGCDGCYASKDHGVIGRLEAR